MILEPVTTLTDYVLTVVYGIAGGRLLAEGRRRAAWSEVLWGMAFLALACGAFLGGTVHGVPHLLGPEGAAWLWMLTLDAIAFASVAFVLAAVRAGTSVRIFPAALGIGVTFFVGFAVWASRTDAFAAASAVSAGAMLATGLLLGRHAHWWIVAGLIVAFVGAAVQASGLAVHRHFNHNDLYHVIQMLSALLLYRGGRLLSDR